MLKFRRVVFLGVGLFSLALGLWADENATKRGTMWAPNKKGVKYEYSPHVTISAPGLAKQDFYFVVHPLSDPCHAGNGTTYCEQTWGFKADFRVDRWEWFTSPCSRAKNSMAIKSVLVRLGNEYSQTRVHYYLTVNHFCADKKFQWNAGDDVGYAMDGWVSDAVSDFAHTQEEWNQVGEVTSGSLSPSQ